MVRYRSVLSGLVCLVGAVGLSLGVPAPAHAQTLAGGEAHSVVLKPDGTVWTFGSNTCGQLGDGTTTPQKTPVQVTGLSDVVTIASGFNHSMAITSTGELYLWGLNANGQIGDGSTTDRTTPVQSSLTNVVAIAAGHSHSLALRSNGDIYSWGRNDFGQLGTGNTTQQTAPTLVGTGVAIAAGGYHSIFVQFNGTVYTTGRNNYGQLGDSTTTQRTSVVQMSGISTAVRAVGGSLFTLVLLSDGTVKSAGYNVDGQLGDNTTTPRSTAVTVSGLTDVSTLIAGYYHSVALKSDGSVWTWGWNAQGQLGDGTNTTRKTPVAVSALSSIVKIGAGFLHSMAVDANGVVYTWGVNNLGNLGDGTTTNRSTPVAISDANYEWKVGAPTFSESGGVYHTELSVVIATVTAGATIHYTQDGSEPTTADATVASGGSVSVTAPQTLKAKAFKSGLPASNTTSASFVLKPVTPSIAPANGTYTSAQGVSTSTPTTDTTLRFSISNTPGVPPPVPTEASTAYTAPFSVATHTIVTVVAFRSGWAPSDPATRTLNFNYGTVPTPSADNAGGSYVDSVTVTLSAIPAATIRYTTNGTAAGTGSTLYSGPLVFDTTKTLRFRAYHPDYATGSAEVSHTYTLSAAAPTFNPTAGNYTAGQLVTVTSPSTGTTMHYTINGSEPTTADPLIASGTTLVVGNYTLKAKAFKSQASPSQTATAAYTITGPVVAAVLAAGSHHSFAIRSDGVAWGWGLNESGQTGTGGSTPPVLLPRVLYGVTGVAGIDGGGSHSHLVTTGATAMGFGLNNGRVGDGTTPSRLVPTHIPGIAGVGQISAGNDHTIAVKTDGTVYGWGDNGEGEVGDGTTTRRLQPVAISLSSIGAVSAGNSFSLALAQDGTIKSWGGNSAGQLGDGTLTRRTSPVAVSSISTATAIAAGSSHALALLADGTVRAWGDNFYGQLGDGSTVNRLTPVQVAGLADVMAIAAGAGFSMALKDDGTVWTWGDNLDGQLGDGTRNRRASPTQVPSLSNIVGIAAGDTHALALTSDGVVHAWGANGDGQLGDGTTTTRLEPAAISGPGMEWKVSTPTLSLASGRYYADQTVTVTIPDPNATIRYTTNGQDPTATDAVVANGGTFSIAQSQILKVSGWRAGAPTSVVTERTYELKVVAPMLTPGAGAYQTSQSVALSTTTSGATIRYTTDGTAVNASSPAYTAPLPVVQTTTLRAVASKAGWTSSNAVTAHYWFPSTSALSAPAIVPGSGAFDSARVVRIQAESGATIRYTTDGSEPEAVSTLYETPFLVAHTTTIKAKAFRGGYSPSATATETFTIDTPGSSGVPVLSPLGGQFATQRVVIVTGPAGATLRYTTNGADPTETDNAISPGATVMVDRSMVLKVRAWQAGLAPSIVRREDYVITGAIDAGEFYSVALKTNGTLWTWGDNLFNQIGDGTTTQRTSPYQVLSDAIAVAAGMRHVVALASDGTVWTWGENFAGEVGDGTTNRRTTPYHITGLTDVVAVAAGFTNSYALKSDGTVWAWGANWAGQIGDGTTTRRLTPVQVPGLTGVQAIDAGEGFAAALVTNGAASGAVWTWGWNAHGQMGDGTTTNRVTPQMVPGLSDVAEIFAGHRWLMARTSSSHLFMWGANDAGQMANGSYGSTSQSTPMRTAPWATSLIALSGGLHHGFAVGRNAKIWGWGNNQSSQLAKPASTDVSVEELTNVALPVSIRGGAVHSLSVAPDGQLWAWGSNARGQFGRGNTTSSITPVAVTGFSVGDNSHLSTDPDGDGLATWREYQLGTDPLSNDTDGDGVPDGVTDSTGARPNLDPDGDGLPTSIELMRGTDPFNPDTDGDGAGDGVDAFPLDPTRTDPLGFDPNDHTAPAIVVTEPTNAVRIP